MKRRYDAFTLGMGVEAPNYTCAECGYQSGNRKNFRNADEGHTCSTGHYTNKTGELKRQKNVYARPR